MDLAPASTRSKSFDVYQQITDQVLAMLEAGVAPWRSPILGAASAGMPRNLHTGKPYRGVNTFLLAFAAAAKGYDSAFWATFNQVKARGGSVKRGERATMVVFWKLYETADRATGDTTRVPVLRYYNVFNVAAQCEGIDVPDRATYQPIDFRPIDAAERIVSGYVDGPPVRPGHAAAFYRPCEDAIYMPEPTRFTSAEEYYGTLFHEHAHGTGHATRLDRKFVAEPRPFGSSDYGREELIAEMAAAFLCGHCGIAPATLANQAAYLWGWAHTIRQDKRMIVAAAGAAQRAADWILNERGQDAD